MSALGRNLHLCTKITSFHLSFFYSTEIPDLVSLCASLHLCWFTILLRVHTVWINSSILPAQRLHLTHIHKLHCQYILNVLQVFTLLVQHINHFRLYLDVTVLQHHQILCEHKFPSPYLLVYFFLSHKLLFVWNYLLISHQLSTITSYYRAVYPREVLINCL